MDDYSDCRCIACGGALVQARSDDADRDGVVVGKYACVQCARAYDEAWGVPLLLEFDSGDFVGLVEIAANASDVTAYTPEGIAHFIDLLKRYHVAEDREALCAEAGPTMGPWLPVRYNDWVAVELLTEGESLAGRKVLDVGAGQGFDSYRHILEGARVTALEHNPILARAGRRSLPMIRWITAASHDLPFAAGTFDAVFCNAALHHMRDLPKAVREMLRVLRPGGVLITTGDPFRGDHTGDDLELAVFNAHPDVLMGVNEQVPRFAAFVQTVEELRDYVEPRIFTQVFREEGLLGARTTDTFREWTLSDDRSRLGAGSGSLGMRIKLTRPLPETARTGAVGGLPRAGVVADWLDRPAEATAKLAAWAPTTIVNRPFPGTAGSKAELLNGWQAPTGDPWRQAYRRGRWYLRRAAEEHALRFELQSTAGGGFAVLLNGEPALDVQVPPGEWTPVSVDLGAAPVDAPFVLEIKLAAPPGDFEAGLFRVRKRLFVGGRRSAAGETVLAGMARLKMQGVARLKTLLRQQLGLS